jgi:uncharacterized protein
MMLPSSLLVKPVSANCNLDCEYCFYKRKKRLFPRAKVMTDEVLEEMTSQFMDIRTSQASFSWQGGEPLLAGLDFYGRAVELQQKHGRGHTVSNAFMTNGTLLDAQWVDFFRDYRFLVGISLDGPRRLHDVYRRKPDGSPTFDLVMKGIGLLKGAGVDFNVLTVVNDVNVDHPEEIYDFLIENDIKHMQFVPCYEIDPETGQGQPFNVSSDSYGEFLCRVFDLWKRDFPDVYIRMFNSVLAMRLGREHGLCTLGPRCGEYVVIEHNGDVYPCDFFVERDTYLGNIMEESLGKIVEKTALREFSRQKSRLDRGCQQCEWVDLCFGGCQYHRKGPGHERRSYFCPSYKRFFEYSDDAYLELEGLV